MTRIHFINNYPMDEAVRLYEASEYPGQHLWGYPTDPSQSSFDWVLPRSTIYGFRWLHGRALKSMRNALVKVVGDPIQQLGVIRRARGNDIVYSADQRSGAFLGFLKSIGLFNRRMVVIVHHPPRTAWERRCLSRVEAALYLSPYVGERLLGSLPGIRVRGLIPWGPDLESPVYRELAETPEPIDFVASGKTNRDYAELRVAAVEERLSGVIFHASGRTNFVDGVISEASGPSGYAEVLTVVKSASCVMIPIADGRVMAGLTEVADAIALNKPILVSESVAFPYALAEVGSGTVLTDWSPVGVRSAIQKAKSGAIGSAGAMALTHNMQVARFVIEDAFRSVGRDGNE